MRWLDSITDSMDMNLSKLQETQQGIVSTPVEDRGAWHAILHGVTKSQMRLGDRTTQYPHEDSISGIPYHQGWPHEEVMANDRTVALILWCFPCRKRITLPHLIPLPTDWRVNMKSRPWKAHLTTWRQSTCQRKQSTKKGNSISGTMEPSQEPWTAYASAVCLSHDQLGSLRANKPIVQLIQTCNRF